MGSSQPQTESRRKARLERICYQCHKVNRRGSLCLLLLREGSDCPRRVFLQRHQSNTPSPTSAPNPQTDTNPTTPAEVTSATGSTAPDIFTLAVRYGKPLSRWRGLFARLDTQSIPDDTEKAAE